MCRAKGLANANDALAWWVLGLGANGNYEVTIIDYNQGLGGSKEVIVNDVVNKVAEDRTLKNIWKMRLEKID